MKSEKKHFITEEVVVKAVLHNAGKLSDTTLVNYARKHGLPRIPGWALKLISTKGNTEFHILITPKNDLSFGLWKEGQLDQLTKNGFSDNGAISYFNAAKGVSHTHHQDVQNIVKKVLSERGIASVVMGTCNLDYFSLWLFGAKRHLPPGLFSMLNNIDRLKAKSACIVCMRHVDLWETSVIKTHNICDVKESQYGKAIGVYISHIVDGLSGAGEGSKLEHIIKDVNVKFNTYLEYLRDKEPVPKVSDAKQPTMGDLFKDLKK